MNNWIFYTFKYTHTRFKFFFKIKRDVFFSPKRPIFCRWTDHNNKTQTKERGASAPHAAWKYRCNRILVDRKISRGETACAFFLILLSSFGRGQCKVDSHHIAAHVRTRVRSVRPHDRNEVSVAVESFRYHVYFNITLRYGGEVLFKSLLFRQLVNLTVQRA